MITALPIPIKTDLHSSSTAVTSWSDLESRRSAGVYSSSDDSRLLCHCLLDIVPIGKYGNTCKTENEPTRVNYI